MNYLKTPLSHRNRTGAYFKCETCKEEFYVYPSRLRRSEKIGDTIRYCSMKCYVKTGTNNPFWGKKHSTQTIEKVRKHPNNHVFTTANNPNLTRYGEESGYIGISFQWWRDKLKRDVSECERCGFLDKRAFNVHHKDRDRKNNNRENLEVLCWNCHMIEHHKDKDGPWLRQQRKI